MLDEHLKWHATPDQLRETIGDVAFAFRGYNVTNLGRTPELLAHSVYGQIVRSYLERGSEICRLVCHRPVDLIDRVTRREETSLDTYHEALALVVATEQRSCRSCGRSSESTLLIPRWPTDLVWEKSAR